MDLNSLIPDNGHNHGEHVDLCLNCKNNFIQCKSCHGYFESLFFDHIHESSCKYKSENSDEFIECDNCNIMIKFCFIQAHLQICETKNCLFCNFPFSLNILKQHQIKCQQEKNELLILKEKEKCSFCKEEVPLSFLENHQKTCKTAVENRVKIEKALNEIKVEYPKEWDTMKAGNNLELFILPINSGEFKLVENLFKKSVNKIIFTKMWRVQNKFLWEKYYREKLKVQNEKGQCFDQFLFHGTRSNSPRVLYTTGFDLSFSSDSGMYGRGIYFARQAIYSYSGYAFNYEKKYYMFLALVQTGKTIQLGSDSSLRKPPFLDRSKYIYYDSVTDVNNPSNSYDVSQMFIVYNNDKAYPFYLMEYEMN